MAKQRSLLDLYVRGKELVLEDDGDSVSVWIQKMNPVEYSKSVRKADAARARVLMSLNDHSSEMYEKLLGDVLAVDREQKVIVLVGDERLRISGMIEEEISLKEEWAENSYLQGIRDAWLDELSQTFIDDPDDEEAKRAHDELTRFLEQVNVAAQADLDEHQGELESLSEKDLNDAVLRWHCKKVGDAAWSDEYTRCEIWFGVRDLDNHKKRSFESREDVDLLQREAIEQLSLGFRELMVDPTEGKDSAGNPPSSASSEPSEVEATDPSSGQPAAAA